MDDYQVEKDELMSGDGVDLSGAGSVGDKIVIMVIDLRYTLNSCKLKIIRRTQVIIRGEMVLVSLNLAVLETRSRSW